MTPQQRSAVVAEAWTWLKTPYHNHARIKAVGVDCAHLLLAVYPALGLSKMVDPGFYPPDWHLHRGEERYMEAIKEAGGVQTDAPQVADIALFRFGRCFSHGAIIVDEGLLMIHAYMGRGVILSRATEEPLDGHAVTYWTL